MSGAQAAGAGEGTGGPDTPGAPKDAATVLERRYRRLLMLLPRSYRAQRGEEMLTALMDSAPENRRWPKLGETLSLATHGVRVRSGLTAEAVPAGAARPLMRAVALLGTLYLSFLSALGLILGLRWNWGIYRSDINHSDLDGHHHTFTELVLLQASGLLFLAAHIAVLLGRRRLVQILGWALIAVDATQITGSYTALAAIPALIVAAALIATGGRRIERSPHLGRWFGVLAALAALMGFLDWHWQGSIERPAALGPMAAVAVAVVTVAVLRAWRKAEWVVAAAIIGGMAGTQDFLDANHYPLWWEGTFDPALTRVLAGEAVLIVAALYGIVRQRQQQRRSAVADADA